MGGLRLRYAHVLGQDASVLIEQIVFDGKVDFVLASIIRELKGEFHSGEIPILFRFGGRVLPHELEELLLGLLVFGVELDSNLFV